MGKTTLAREIEARFGLKYNHLSKLPDNHDRNNDYFTFESSPKGAVLDRFHFSDPIYRAVEGVQEYYHANNLAWVDVRLNFLGAFSLVIYAEDEDLIKSRWRDGEMYSIEQVIEANRLYMLLADTSSYPYEGLFCHTSVHCVTAETLLTNTDDLLDELWERATTLERVSCDMMLHVLADQNHSLTTRPPGEN